MTLGLVKFCALPIYGGQENANLDPDSPNPASQIPCLRMNDTLRPSQIERYGKEGGRKGVLCSGISSSGFEREQEQEIQNEREIVQG